LCETIRDERCWLAAALSNRVRLRFPRLHIGWVVTAPYDSRGTRRFAGDVEISLP
jgi:hypothetical protein